MQRIKRGSGTRLDYRKGSGGTVEILDIVVNRPDRRRGYGTSMIDELKKRVKTNLIFAITRHNNEIAKQFYLANGFREVAYLDNFYKEGDAIMYGLDV